MARSLEKPGNASKNGLEWTVFALSCLLVTATLALLVSEALRRNGAPVELLAEVEKAQTSGDWVRVPVRVSNRGDTSAADVSVEVAARGSQGDLRAGFTLEFVPRASQRTGWAIFRSDDEPTDFRVKVLGYEEP